MKAAAFAKLAFKAGTAYYGQFNGPQAVAAGGQVLLALERGRFKYLHAEGKTGADILSLVPFDGAHQVAGAELEKLLAAWFACEKVDEAEPPKPGKKKVVADEDDEDIEGDDDEEEEDEEDDKPRRKTPEQARAAAERKRFHAEQRAARRAMERKHRNPSRGRR